MLRAVHPVTLTLEISFEGDLPIGHALDAHGASREFAGWLGLVTAVEDLLTDAAGEPARVDAEPRP